jgi:ubiquinone/menaquinone biosynthesis C-methylase UbiE
MAQRLGARVTLIDVTRYNQTNLPLTICDSRALAFADRSFDCAVLSFVLHHTPDPDAILSEALRVARQVVVVENDVHGTIRGLLTHAVDSWPAVRYGTPPCYVAREREAWLESFRRFPVAVRVLGEFTLGFGFFRCFTVELRHSPSSA